MPTCLIIFLVAYESILNRTASYDIENDMQLAWDMVEK